MYLCFYFCSYLNIWKNNTFSLQQLSKSGNICPKLISRQYKLNLMAKFMQIKFEKPKLKQSGIADRLGNSISTLKRYRKDINMFWPNRIQLNNTNKQTKSFQILTLPTINILNMISQNLKGPQMSLINLEQLQNLTRLTKVL